MNEYYGDTDPELSYDSDYDPMEVDSDVLNDEEVYMNSESEDESDIYSGNTNDSTSRDSNIHSLPVDLDNSSNSSDSQVSSNGSSSVEQNVDSLPTEQITNPSVIVPMTISSSKNVENSEENADNVSSNFNMGEEDAFSCPICLEGLTNTGGHKPACLKCGHIFGENCLQRWIKTGCNNDARRCPTCNTKASLKDIRILYAKKLVAIDTSELTALEIKLEKEIREKNLMKQEVEKWKIRSESLSNDLQKLRETVEKSGHSGQGYSSSGVTSIRQCLKKIIMCKDAGGCRVLAFDKKSMLLAVTQQCETPLFNNAHGIRKVNASIFELSKECVYAHKKTIRDMAFHPVDNNLIASASLDKCVKLTDFNSNGVIASVETPEPLWSCCWAGDNSNILVAGSQMGSLFYIDRRFMKLVESDIKRAPACVSLVPLPPSNNRKFICGGFLRSRMDLLSIFEQDTNAIIYKETALSLKGLWSSTTYDDTSNLLLTSAKPCGANKSVRHIVSKIASFDEQMEIQPVVTFYGGDKATQISRSCIIPQSRSDEDTLVCAYDEKSNHIKLYSVNSGKNIHNFQVRDTFLDLCHLSGVVINERRILAALSEKSLSIFSV
ncbi:E3 ubiquitin-protein ligase RFWD3-like isoform X2 [Daktulosphaira vitifoliae]|uniref:E3 ubiquitin-protein ligase RFWD3-like isoform X2 n=1 Tax=Daktulosphaira vitifoliae TaxID=58002 RepID=UPI0021AA54D8|nr:E3 ubiquitin-protein ligase RFWD3-like isoform X2 [Daktulosphaira vitifoliae]